jgi:hypothetical protein
MTFESSTHSLTLLESIKEQGATIFSITTFHLTTFSIMKLILRILNLVILVTALTLAPWVSRQQQRLYLFTVLMPK